MEWFQNKTTQLIALVTIIGTLAGFGYTGATYVNRLENLEGQIASIGETEIQSKIDLRIKARVNKNYKEADRIRDELLDKGVLIEDKDGKTIWKFR